MKTLLKSLLFITVAALGVPASAAPENHEEFARQYMPESQAVFERFRKECAETQKLCSALNEDLHAMVIGGSTCMGTLLYKIGVLNARESFWANSLKDMFFKHKAGMISSEQLEIKNQEIAKEAIEWENSVLKPMIKDYLFALENNIPFVVKIPGKNYAFGVCEIGQEECLALAKIHGFDLGDISEKDKAVTIENAKKFCTLLTIRDRALGRITENQRYRLPTSEEWEHACRAGTTTKYYTGDSYPEGADIPNMYGLRGMHNGSWEWTSTFEIKSYSSKPEYIIRGGLFGSRYQSRRQAESGSSEMEYIGGYGTDGSNGYYYKSACGIRIVLEPVSTNK